MSIKLLKYILFMLCAFQCLVAVALDLSSFKKYFSNKLEKNGDQNKSSEKAILMKEKLICDENRLMLRLAELYTISPERIILLVTVDTIKKICNEIARITTKINSDFETCQPLNSSNMYMKLYAGVKTFYEDLCQDDLKVKKLSADHECIKELREEYMDCEGPADWFEWTNITLLCQQFVDILNCDYIKTSELCGLDCAWEIRRLSLDVFRASLPHKCKIPKTLPNVRNPMPVATSGIRLFILGGIIYPSILIFLYKYIFYVKYNIY